MKADDLLLARLASVLLLVICVLAPVSSRGASPVIVPPPEPDPHYTAIGFFDVRVCQWPELPLFMQVLFSTTNFAVVRNVEILNSDGKLVGHLPLDKYRLIKQKDGSEKRVFMSPFPIPPGTKGGWYTGRITTTEGKVYLAKDLVDIKALPMARNLKPAKDVENIPAPSYLSWDPVPGASMYQVLVHDVWEGEQLIFRSPHLRENRVKLPDGLMRPGGYYMWRVHARDVDGDIQLGDFNHGSLTPFVRFSVK